MSLLLSFRVWAFELRRRRLYAELSLHRQVEEAISDDIREIETRLASALAERASP